MSPTAWANQGGRSAMLTAKAEKHVAALPDTRLKAALEFMLKALGQPYLWGGDDGELDAGYDCVGLVYRAFHHARLEFPWARYSSMNMTQVERGASIPKVWWTAYTEDFAKVMRSCDGRDFQDGDVLVYHSLAQGKVIDRTGHVVVVIDAKTGLTLSAARGGVRLHSLGDMRRYDNKDLTACWRALSTSTPRFQAPNLVWQIDIKGVEKAGTGTHHAPFVIKPPLNLSVSVAAEFASLTKARLVAHGRVLSLIGSVSPTIDELPSLRADTRRWRVQHDFKQQDLPVDPGETIKTPRRKIVLRLFNEQNELLGEKSFYVEFKPYW